MEISKSHCALRLHLACPNRLGLTTPSEKIGEVSLWQLPAAMADGSGERRCDGVRKWVGDEASDEGNPFWGLGREDAHHRRLPVVAHVGQKGAPAAGQRSGR
jgi:hypothetical protein